MTLIIGRRSGFQSDIIEILAGPDEERFYAHQDKLRAASPFFKVCFKSNMEEASSKKVRLPEDTPTCFNVILAWIYDGKIEAPVGAHRDKVQTLVHAHFLADKLCMEACANMCMDVVRNWHKTGDTFANLARNFCSSAMKSFLISQLAWELSEIKTTSIWNTQVDVARQEVRDFFSKGGELAVEVLDLVANNEHSERLGVSPLQPACSSDCEYHKHVDTEPCHKHGD
jgi:BTB/POZ domain